MLEEMDEHRERALKYLESMAGESDPAIAQALQKAVKNVKSRESARPGSPTMEEE